MDIGAGILIALGVGSLFGGNVSSWFVVLGIVFALLPDSDILLSFLPKQQTIQKVFGSHRSVFHNPLLYVPIAAIIYFFFDSMGGTLFAFCVLYHFIHDTFFLGWGIKWLWPFSHIKISLFHDRNGKITSDILIWEPHEEERLRKKYASPNWIRDFYFRPSIVSLTEYPIFLFSLLVWYWHSTL